GGGEGDPAARAWDSCLSANGGWSFPGNREDFAHGCGSDPAVAAHPHRGGLVPGIPVVGRLSVGRCAADDDPVNQESLGHRNDDFTIFGLLVDLGNCPQCALAVVVQPVLALVVDGDFEVDRERNAPCVTVVLLQPGDQL